MKISKRFSTQRRLEISAQPILTTLLLIVGATHALAATNVAVNASFLSSDPECVVPQYSFAVTGTNTNNDDGLGNDIVTVVVHDAGFRVLDIDAISLPVGGNADISYTLSSAFTARPIYVRVHDTIANESDSETYLATTLTYPLLTELVIDPGTDSPPCALAPVGPEIRIESTSSDVTLSESTTTEMLVDSLEVITPREAQLVLSYSAECAVAGSPSSWLGLRMAVDGTTVAPTGSAYALCAGTGSGLTDWFAGRVLGSLDVPAGAHTVEVFADASSSVAGWWLGNRSLSVTVPEPGLSGLLTAGILGLTVFARRSRTIARVRCDRSTFATAAISGLILFGGANEGLAQTQIDAKTNPNAQLLTDANATILELDDGGSLRIAYDPNRAERVQITVTAECRVDSTVTDQAYVGLEILINGTVIDPTNPALAFCSSDDGSETSGWVGSSTTVVRDVLDTGVIQSVQVRARLQNWTAGETARIDDLSVIVIRTPYTFPQLF